jgi:sorbitol/mannitol transport system substrate-binding protein
LYRKDLFEQKGLKMPEQPTYEDIAKFAAALNDKEHGFFGLALRGQTGWGENMATVDTMANSFGATWFDMDWHPTRLSSSRAERSGGVLEFWALSEIFLASAVKP